MCGCISHCTALKALGFWSKYCSLYLNEMISLLSGAVLPPVLRPRQCVRDPPFNILPSIVFAFWKFVFHGEEHHQSNSRITPNYLHCRIFGHFRAQLLTDASYTGKVIILWYLLSCIYKLCSCDREICELTFYTKVKRNPGCGTESWSDVYYFSLSGVNFHLPSICLLTPNIGVHVAFLYIICVWVSASHHTKAS